MSTPFYDLASLVLVPSGYKAQKVYAQKPLTTDGQLTFSRASTATRVNSAGLIETVSSNVPRLDYLNSSCPKLQLEPQRTNVALYSQQLDDGVINKLNTTVTANNATSPDGTQNADLIIETTTNGIHICGYDKASITSGTAYTASVFLKKTTGSPDWIQVAYSTTGLAGFANFNLSTGAVGNVISGGSAKIENYGNGWYRCSLTQTANATGTAGGPIIVFTNNTNPNQRYVSYAGSTSVSILAWGLQLEAGSYVSSYIGPTTSAAVTRLADACSKTGVSSLIGQTEGTLFCDVEWTVKPEAGSPIISLVSLNNTTNLQNCIVLGIERQSGGTNRFYSFVQVSNSTTAALIGSNITNGRYKAAFAYKENDFVLYVNGVQIATDTSGAVPTNSQVIVGGRFVGDSFQVSDPISQALVFKTRLTNAQLAELTTL